MQQDGHGGGERPGADVQSLRSTALFLGFGLMLLALLVAIDRQNWFELRPASGTAAAMYHASDGARAEASTTRG